MRWGMMRGARCVGFGFVALVCGCSTPYQPMGVRGGYDDYRAGAGGLVMVTFQGNGYTSESAVVRMWHRRAAEVCGGDDRYEVVDASRSATVTEGASTSQTHVTVSGNTAYATTTTQPGMRWTKHKLEGLVRCVDGGAYELHRGEDGQ